MNAVTAWGHAYIESLTDEDFRNLTTYQKSVGFLVRVAPIYLRLLILLAYCFMVVMNVQVLLLPECNGLAILTGAGEPNILSRPVM